jgi:ABC-2 type transport system ATP-binding protein
MIALQSAAARHAPLSRSSLTLDWGPGVHAVVGSPADGGPLLLALVAGRERLRRGTLRVLDGAPGDARVRTQIALVPRAAALPEPMRVHEVLDLAATVRGEPRRPAAERLALLGIESLAARPVRSLSREEARAVALAEALTSARVRVLLVEEPRVDLDPRAASRVPELLRARAAAGCAVLVATASVRDAGDLADDHVLLQQGAVAGQAASLDALGAFTPSGARLVVLASDPQALVAAVAREPDVVGISRREALVVARGKDPTTLARAVGRAVVASGVEVIEMRLESPTLDEARSAAAGIAQATFESARARTLATLAVQPTEPSS